MIHPRLCVNAFSTFNWTFDQDLALWRDLGLHTVGLYAAKLAEDPADQFSRLADAGLAVAVVTCSPLDLQNPASWSATHERVARIMDLVSQAGGGTVYFPPGRTTGAPWDEVLDIFIEAVTPLREHALVRGVRLCIEPTSRLDVSFITTLRDAADVAARTGIGYVADFASCWMERGVGETLRRSGQHLGLVQLCDVQIGTRTMPARGGRVHVGEGELPLRRLIGQCLEAGYAGFFDLEVLGPVIEEEGYERALRRGVASASALLAETVP